MVNEVNKIVFNTLVTHQAISLPGIGTLTIVRRSATMRSKRVVTSPSYAIEFSSREYGLSLVDAIAQCAKISTENAEDIYTRWLSKVKDGNKIVINNIGTITDKSFIADVTILSTLNIDSNNILKIRAKRNKCPYVIAIITIVVAMAAAALYALCPDEEQSSRVVEDNNTVVLHESSEHKSETASSIYEPVEEVEAVVVQTTSVENITDVDANIETDIEHNENISISEDTVITESIESTTTKWCDNDDIRHWVVAGSYSTEENAQRAIDQINRKHPDITCQQFKLGKMYAIAIFGSSKLSECEEFVRSEKKRFKEMWIHTPKRFK